MFSMATRPPGFHGLFGSRARPSSLTSNQSRLSRVDSAEITPALIEAQEQASHAISRKLDHLFSGGGVAIESKKKKLTTRKRKKQAPGVKKRKVAVKKNKKKLIKKVQKKKTVSKTKKKTARR